MAAKLFKSLVVTVSLWLRRLWRLMLVLALKPLNEVTHRVLSGRGCRLRVGESQSAK